MLNLVDICICTFRRPNLLGLLLKSLVGQRLDDRTFINIIIIDNDLKGSAQRVVDEFRKSLSIEYYIEVKRGISYARNLALSHTKNDFIAFIDDDEIASPNWIMEHIKAVKNYDADVIFGPVHYDLPHNVQKWAKDIFKRSNEIESGSIVEHGATSNVLVRADIIRSNNMRFKEEYALTGGGDTEFFYRLSQSGFKQVWCNTPLVYEAIPQERLTISWLCLRSYRSGQCVARIFILPKYNPIEKCKFIVKKIIGLVVNILLLPGILFIGYSLYIQKLMQISGLLGQITVLLGSKKYYEEYSNKNYR